MTPGPWKAFSYEVVDARDKTIARTSTTFRPYDEERANAAVIAMLPELILAVRLFVHHHEQIPAVPVDPDIGWGPESGGCVCAYCSRFKPFLAVVDQKS